MTSFSLPAARVELSLIRGVFDDHLVIGGARLDWRQFQSWNMRGRVRDGLYESHVLKNEANRQRSSAWLIAADDPRRAALGDYVEQTERHFEVVGARWLAKAARLDPALFNEGISISLDFAFEILDDQRKPVQEPHRLTLAAGGGPDDFSYPWYCRRAGNMAQPYDNPAFGVAAAELDAALADEVESFLDGLDEDFQALAESLAS